MKAKLVVEGKEFDIEILDPKLQELIAPKKKTGYERVEQGKEFIFQRSDGVAMAGYDHHNVNCNNYFDAANYYSSSVVGDNNVRADKLMRQLRRFAVEHRENKIDWHNENQHKYFISYDRWDKTLEVEYDTQYKVFGVIYFDSHKAAELAIEAFKDELFWYFAEYKDSL
jgi:hypothetical protein